MHNDISEELPVRILVGDRVISPTLPADSFSTFVLQTAPSKRLAGRGSQMTTRSPRGLLLIPRIPRIGADDSRATAAPFTFRCRACPQRDRPPVHRQTPHPPMRHQVEVPRRMPRRTALGRDQHEAVLGVHGEVSMTERRLPVTRPTVCS